MPTAVQAIDFANIQVPPPVGFIRSDTEMIHCGQNVWITVQNYNNAKAAAGTDAIFVKNIAVDIFSREVLKSSSVTGKISNRTKAPQKPKLDSVKMLAVRDIYRYYLKEHRQLSEDEINARIDNYTEYIRVKISDLERPKKPTRSEGSDKKKDGEKKIEIMHLSYRKKKLKAPMRVRLLVRPVPIRKKKVRIQRVRVVMAMNVHKIENFLSGLKF